MANHGANRLPMSDKPVWARVMRPRIPLVYLDLNHFIFLARAKADDPTTPPGYRELLIVARRATEQRRALVVLSAEHLFEMSAISDPRQRSDLADVMEELSGFHYILGRSELARSELEAGISTLLGDGDEPEHLPLVGPSFGRAFGMRGGVTIRNAADADDAERLRLSLGHDAYETMMRGLNRTLRAPHAAGTKRRRCVSAQVGVRQSSRAGPQGACFALSL